MKNTKLFAKLTLLGLAATLSIGAGNAVAQSSKSDKDFYRQQQQRSQENRATNNRIVNNNAQQQRYESTRRR